MENKNNVTIDTTNMESFELFPAFDYKSVTNEDIVRIKAVFDSFNYDLKVTSADVSLFDVRPSHGELIANIGSLFNTCRGVSVWLTVKDFGVRIDQKHYDDFCNIDTCKMLLQDVKKAKVKHNQAHGNEYRYSFNSVDSMISFMSDLFDCYNASKHETTKEIVTVESVTA